jgi:predicted AAA+ superfamily ATPase
LITRALQVILQERLKDTRAILLLGARRTGKTTLIKAILKTEEKVLLLNGDEKQTRALFGPETSTESLRQLLAGYKVVFIDEAQRIDDVGIKLKLITDGIPEIKLIATGSSAFELANKINEPLTGRKWEFRLYPFSYAEMVKHHGWLKEKQLLHHRLIYGLYPEVVNSPGKEQIILNELSEDYLFKDILIWQGIKRADKLEQLLQALAFQVGHEVTYHQLGKLIGLDNQTIEKYINLLEQCYVIFRLPAFTRNIRKEIKRGRKIYFFDNGIRNALLANFQPIELRNDVGALWENFLVSERVKRNENIQYFSNSFFWRTTDQQEIDYIEEANGIIQAYEFKWSPLKNKRIPDIFDKAYPGSRFETIHPENFEHFLT